MLMKLFITSGKGIRLAEEASWTKQSFTQTEPMFFTRIKNQLDNLDGSQGDDTEWKKPIFKGYEWYNSI